ncbi:MAG TPA: glycosyltransferase [Ktedonobacteraceae bacterium]|nr:glycosyltransferase [Ktedonobacteraceae bacterium]
MNKTSKTSKMWFTPKEPGSKRILIHAINHVGLGHMNRAISVAQWLKKDMPGLQVLFLVEGGEDFIAPTGFPWIFVAGQGNELESYERMTRTALELFRPDLSIHETFLREQIHYPVRDAGIKQILMGNVGNILRTQFRDRLSMVNDMKLAIILQQQEEVEPADQALIAGYKGKTLYAGPLVRYKKQVMGGDLRQKLGLTPEQKVILLTLAGGGWDASKDILNNILSAREAILTAHPEARLIAITGPYFTGELPAIDDFVCYASKFEPFFNDYLDISSVVVSMAGYSTVNEVAGSGIPAVCVPTAESGDQVGTGSMSEYAQSFPNMVVSSTRKEELAQKVIDALGQQRNLSVVQAFWSRAEKASSAIVGEIKSLLNTGE